MTLPRGILFHGSPGTGKTLLGMAASKELKDVGATIIFVNGSELLDENIGAGANRVRELFSQAKSCTGYVMIFIEEIDVVGRTRDDNNERYATLTQLLGEMDGFDQNGKIFILATTNRYDDLDSALTRAGRFDRNVRIELPNAADRASIMAIHLR